MAEPAKARVKIAWTLSLFSQADPGSSYGSAWISFYSYVWDILSYSIAHFLVYLEKGGLAWLFPHFSLLVNVSRVI